MKSLTEMTDKCIKMMKPHVLWDWEKWWVTITGDDDVPGSKTFAYHVWMKKRCELKDKINKEMRARKMPETLMCTGLGEGIYLVNQEDIAEMTVTRRMRTIIASFEKSQKEMRLLTTCERLSPVDRKMLTGLGSMIELQENTMIGTMSKLKSLPAPAKKILFKKLGLKT